MVGESGSHPLHYSFMVLPPGSETNMAYSCLNSLDGFGLMTAHSMSSCLEFGEVMSVVTSSTVVGPRWPLASVCSSPGFIAPYRDLLDVYGTLLRL